MTIRPELAQRLYETAKEQRKETGINDYAFAGKRVNEVLDQIDAEQKQEEQNEKE